MKTYLILFSVFTASLSYCQIDEGYEDGMIITKSGDTTRCLIGLGVRSPVTGMMNLKKTPEEKASLFPIKEIHAIQTAYLYLENIQLRKKEILMVRLVEGNTQLFSHTTLHERMTSVPYGSTQTESQPPTIIYAVIKAGQIHEMRRKSFIETAWFLFKDCRPLAESILRKENKYEDMERIVVQYNICK